MSKKGFVPDDAGIQKLLKSKEMLNAMEGYVPKIENVKGTRPFIGFDRAKVFVKTDKETATKYR